MIFRKTFNCALSIIDGFPATEMPENRSLDNAFYREMCPDGEVYKWRAHPDQPIVTDHFKKINRTVQISRRFGNECCFCVIKGDQLILHILWGTNVIHSARTAKIKNHVRYPLPMTLVRV